MIWYACLWLPRDTATHILAALATLTPHLMCEPHRTGLRVALDLGSVSASEAQRLGRHAALVASEPPRAVGIAHTRLVARLAAQQTTAGASRLVVPGEEAAFLAPLPIEVLALTPALHERLLRIGIRTVGLLAALRLDALQAQFGSVGRDLFALARGRDLTPFVLEPIAPTLQFRRLFDGPVVNLHALVTALHRLAAHLCHALTSGGWAAGALTLTLECEDAPPVIMARVLAQPSTQERLITQHLEGMLRAANISSGVVALCIAVPRLIPLAVEQLSLLPPVRGQAEQRATLVEALAPHLHRQFVHASVSAPRAYLAEQRVSFTPWAEQ